MRDPYLRLKKAVNNSIDFEEFLNKVLNWTSWYITTDELRGWTKAHLKDYYEKSKRGEL